MLLKFFRDFSVRRYTNSHIKLRSTAKVFGTFSQEIFNVSGISLDAHSGLFGLLFEG